MIVYQRTLKICVEVILGPQLSVHMPLNLLRILFSLHCTYLILLARVTAISKGVCDGSLQQR